MVTVNKDSKNNGLFSVKEVAEACNVTGQTIKRWERKGKIPPHVEKESNGNWFFTQQARNAAVNYATSVVTPTAK